MPPFGSCKPWRWCWGRPAKERTCRACLDPVRVLLLTLLDIALLQGRYRGTVRNRCTISTGENTSTNGSYNVVGYIDALHEVQRSHSREAKSRLCQAWNNSARGSVLIRHMPLFSRCTSHCHSSHSQPPPTPFPTPDPSQPCNQ